MVGVGVGVHKSSGTGSHPELQEIRMLCLFRFPISDLLAALFGGDYRVMNVAGNRHTAQTRHGTQDQAGAQAKHA